MKFKATVTINMGLYMDIRPEIEVDTDNLEEARELVRNLYMAFFGLLNGTPEDLKQVNHKLQELADNAREGKASSIVDYQEVVEKVPGAATKINEAKKAHNRAVYASKKATKKAESELDHALDLQGQMDSEATN